MTDPNYTALLIVLDRSGSMTTIRDDMVGGLEQMLADHAQAPGMLTVDIVTFDTEIELTHSFAAPADVQVVLEPRGGTALYDAVGVSVNGFGAALAALPEHARPSVVQVIIVTDGMENASREYTLDAVRALVEHQTEKYSWEFVFLGANQDAVLTARGLGIAAEDAMTYAPAPGSVRSMHDSMTQKLHASRQHARRGFTDDERAGAAENRES